MADEHVEFERISLKLENGYALDSGLGPALFLAS
jgi:hypothetical protein